MEKSLKGVVGGNVSELRHGIPNSYSLRLFFILRNALKPWRVGLTLLRYGNLEAQGKYPNTHRTSEKRPSATVVLDLINSKTQSRTRNTRRFRIVSGIRRSRHQKRYVENEKAEEIEDEGACRQCQAFFRRRDGKCSSRAGKPNPAFSEAIMSPRRGLCQGLRGCLIDE